MRYFQASSALDLLDALLTDSAPSTPVYCDDGHSNRDTYPWRTLAGIGWRDRLDLEAFDAAVGCLWDTANLEEVIRRF